MFDITKAFSTRRDAIAFAGGKACIAYNPSPLTKAEVVSNGIPAGTMILSPSGIQHVKQDLSPTTVDSLPVLNDIGHFTVDFSVGGEYVLAKGDNALPITLHKSNTMSCNADGQLFLQAGFYVFDLTWLGGGKLFIEDVASHTVLASGFRFPCPDSVDLEELVCHDTLVFQLTNSTTVYLELVSYNSDDVVIEASNTGLAYFLQGIIYHAV